MMSQCVMQSYYCKKYGPKIFCRKCKASNSEKHMNNILLPFYDILISEKCFGHLQQNLAPMADSTNVCCKKHLTNMCTL